MSDEDIEFELIADAEEETRMEQLDGLEKVVRTFEY